MLDSRQLTINVWLLLFEEDKYPRWVSGAYRKLLAKVDNGAIKPNVVVAKDGSDQFKTIGATLATYPKNFKGRYVIYVKARIYYKYITIDKKTVNVFMYGDGSRKTIVTKDKSSKNFCTMQTATSCKYITLNYNFISQ
ncbi:pectinesterase [Tripterygium wilfordii]|uniref:Pectinesterase n=1 Tax=Tripterygium wilfordii TaxID=458696 RepID=A0A7J7DH27_TRIWF|nr:pectinesterase [Tripterygium wilfordii]